MSIQENITREEIRHRGGGVELDLSGFGYEDEYLERLSELLRRWDAWHGYQQLYHRGLGDG